MDDETTRDDSDDDVEVQSPDEPVSTFVELKSFKAVDIDGDGGFEGYGAVYNNRDLGGDVMRPGSVKNVDALVREGFIGLNHGWDDLPIGMITDARQDTHGLWIQTAYHSHEKAQMARRVAMERLDAGKIVGLSIGYSIQPNGARGLADGSRELLAVDVHEVSQVNAAMNPSAMIDVAKSATSYADQYRRASGSLAELEAFVSRSSSLADVRVKEGRVLSSANRSRLATLLEALTAVRSDIEKLLRDTEPDKSLDATVLLTDYLKLSAQANGLELSHV